MPWTTPVPLPQPDFQLTYRDGILSLGSCFAAHMSRYLEARWWRVTASPFGIVYHPAALAHSLRVLHSPKGYTASDLFEHAGRWHSFDHHSDWSHPDRDVALRRMNARLAEAHEAAREARVLLLTLGTAWGYWHREQRRWVANCHKVPQRAFEKKMTSVEWATAQLADALRALRTLNPALRVVVTVSPVRHLRDGLIENQRSKATLVLVAQQLVESLEGVTYFPAYEIVLDELRDYRFYAADMVHLNEVGLDYVWEQFAATFIAEEAHPLMAQLEKLRRAMAHRPFVPDSAEHRQFRAAMHRKAAALQAQHSYLDLGEALAFFEG